MNYDKDSIEFLPKPTHQLFKDLTGQRYGRLIVIGYAGRKPSRRQMWFCQCSCGNITKIQQGNLRNSHTLSCGCVRDEKISAVNLTHGLTKHPLYCTWLNVRRRCYDPKYPKYASYGARGIRVCRSWRDNFVNFLADMGEKPSRTHSIERIDNNGHYSCGHCEECRQHNWAANCKWATPTEQSRNRRSNLSLTFNGKTQVLAEWAETLDVPLGRLIRRLQLGWSVERTLTAPLGQRSSSSSST